jgi:hypothetical protein
VNIAASAQALITLGSPVTTTVKLITLSAPTSAKLIVYHQNLDRKYEQTKVWY